ncbi:carbohydrate sulfotransferase 11-like [Acanthaster planci]|uniref:Carbohydrate sulfotransferase n=1 Tax=Acanthaster planci TaxID=133434 RepID=A0A8B7Y6U3_ACAPL|nr:carbohydrate sulfotransferase 11-like [Acanthaster planci]
MALGRHVPHRWVWRVCRHWFPQLFLLTCFIYLVFYVVTQIEFDAPVSLSRPKSIRQHEDYPWVDDKFAPVKKPPSGADVSDSMQAQNASRSQVKDSDKERQDTKDAWNNEYEPNGFMEQQAAIQMERRSHVNKACSNYPKLSQGSLNMETLRHIYVHEKHKILYCFVPKVGCSNWKRVLMVLAGLREETEGISSNEAHFKNGMKRLSALTPSEQKIRLKTYTKFMYARQPFLRILSAYRNKFADIKMYRKEPYFQGFAKRIMKHYRKDATPRELQTGENITWHEWVTYLTNPTERAGFDDHWQEIYKMCSPCKVKYDYLGKLETIGDDARYMLTSLGLQDQVSYPTKANSHPTNSSKTYDEYFNQVPKATLQRLWELYRLDFELFGYAKPDLM